MNIRERLNEEISSIRKQRYQFLLIKSQQSNEKILLDVIDKLDFPSINVNIELANRLREVPLSRRQRVVKDELQLLVSGYHNDVVFLDRIHYLFDEELKQDPLGLIEYISGNKVILVNWPGEVKNSFLKYGTPDHPEYFEANGYDEHIVQL